MSTLSLSKYQGAGNDFILIDDRRLQFPSENKQLIAHLCNRRFGIGADGLMLLQDPFRMRIFNSDGSEASCCGNGIRCFARFAFDLGLNPSHVQTEDRTVPVQLRGDEISVAIGAPTEMRCNLPTDRGVVHFAHIGVPHAVQFVSSVDAIEIGSLGPYFRRHPHFGPNGANVNFASIQPDGELHMRTFERGIEAETFACGTGACAAVALAASLHGLSGLISVQFPGGKLAIKWEGGQMEMIGPAVKVFEAVIKI